MASPLEAASQHASRDVPVARPGDLAGEVRVGLLGRSFHSADDVVVLDGERVAGLLPIERLLGAPAGALVDELMDSDPPLLTPGVDQELVAATMIKHGQSSVAIVDADGLFAGLISPHRMLSVLLAEHEEDLARVGGYTAATESARRAAEEPVGDRLRHRLPWLLVGLLGAMLSAIIVGAFEEQLRQEVLLAVFVPGVIYLADAVGTQTEAILIRGMAVGTSIRDVFARELASGAVIGVVIAGAFAPFAFVVWGDGRVALAVSLALLASCSIATLVAMLLPWAMNRAGLDPAFGAGPLATVVQDLLSILVYFAVAVAIVS